MKKVNQEKNSTFIRLMKMMKKRFWLYTLAIVGMGITMSAFQMVSAFLLKNIIKMAQSGNSDGIVIMIIENIIAGIAVLLIYQVASITYTIEAKKGCANLQKEVFFKSMRLPYAYYENTHSGDFMSKLMYDSDRASDVYGSRFRRLLMPTIMVLFYMVPMFWLSWQVTACLMVLCVMTFVVNSLFVRPMKQIGRKLSRKHATLTENLSNLLAGMELAKIFSLDEKLVDNYENVNHEYLKGQKKKNILSSSLDCLNECFDLLSTLAFLAIGIYFVSKKITTIDTLAAIYVMYGSLSWNFLQIGRYIPELMNCLANAQRVFEFMDLEEEPVSYREISDTVQTDDSECARGTDDAGYVSGTDDNYIEMNNVCFAYDSENKDSKDSKGSKNSINRNDSSDGTTTGANKDGGGIEESGNRKDLNGQENNRKILDDFSLHIRKGTTVALTGASGKGKSTLAKLLLGFYPIQSGKISIAGKAYGSMTLEEIRNMIGYVPQEPYLYNVSIAENIAYGKENVTMEEIVEAAKSANAHKFIENQENGYDTIAGERGNKLSGGEKQRIAIARAILKNAPILILDEATSALDNESERLVSEALDRLMVGRTTIMIAHRLSTIERADVVVELN